MTETFGERLKRLRTEAGMTQQQLAEACGASTPVVISQWEIDRNHPRVFAINRVADALNVTANYLLTGRDARIPNRNPGSRSAKRGEQDSEETFGERLNRLRVAKGLTLEALGKQANVSNVSVCYWENETRKPSIDTIAALARALNVTTDYLLTGRDPDDALRAAILRGTKPEILLAMARREL